MSAKIIPFRGITRLDLEPDAVLENNKGALAGVVIMGWDHDGEEVLRCKRRLLTDE